MPHFNPALHSKFEMNNRIFTVTGITWKAGKRTELTFIEDETNTEYTRKFDMIINLIEEEKITYAGYENLKPR